VGIFAKHRRRLGWVSLLILLAAAPFMRGQGAGENANIQSPPTPIQITADHAATWVENGERVFLLQGNVSLEQGATTITMGRGAIWVDLKRQAATGAYFLQAYGDDGIQVDVKGAKRQGPRGLFSMTTTGDFVVKSTVTKVVERDVSTDPSYVQAAEARRRAAEPAPHVPLARGAAPQSDASQPPLATLAPIQQVQAVEPVPPPPVFPTPPPVQVAPVPNAPQPNAPVPTTPTVPVPMPTPPPPPFFGPATAPPPPQPPLPPAAPRRFVIKPRSSRGFSAQINGAPKTTPNGEHVYVLSEPVIVSITDPKNPVGVLDIEADRIVIWTRGGSGLQLFDSMRSPQGETSRHMEFYVAGNVEMRSKTKKEEFYHRCDELYYDVSRNVAIATKSDLEIRQPKLPYPVHLKSDELLQLNAKTFQADRAEIFSTQLPSDPGLKVYLKTVTVEELEIPKKTIFGTPVYDLKTGQAVVDNQRFFDGRNVLLYAENVPFFYFPVIKGNVEDPLGPLESIGLGGSNIFGFTFQSTWDIYQLLGIERPDNTRWRLYLDYLSARGPAAGTEFSARSGDGAPFRYSGFFKAWGLYDPGVDGTRTDILGGERGKFRFPPPPGTLVPFTHPEWRGRVQTRWNILDLPDGFTVQAQLALISDQNFLEQYYLNEWLNDINQETFLYVKQQHNQWAWTILGEPRLRQWNTEAAWLPRADGWLLGQKLFDDWATWNLHGSAGYAQFRTPNVPSFAYLPTDVPVDTGRFDVWSELSVPFTAGAFRFAPYIVGDAAYYTSNVNDEGQSRILGGAGLRSSIPFSRLYPDIQSEFFNLDSIYHKINFSTNYLYARSSTSFSNLPQLDRLNDDTTDQALRDLQVRQIFINPVNAAFLTNVNGLINPQTYAIRRLIDSRIDTMDNLHVVQFNLENRWQTRRGIAASEHVVDWMTLNLGASLFPQPSRDNFGENWGILEYDWTWNIGDRTALVSNGWTEPVEDGPRVFNVGAVLNRYDATNFYLGYRQIDPLNSKAVVANVAYSFSQKYSINASTVWDFGIGQQTYGFGVTRLGTDIQMSLGLSYNSVLKNFGVQFEIIPNLLKSSIRTNPGVGNCYSLTGR
jgi:hypothetical protein